MQTEYSKADTPYKSATAYHQLRGRILTGELDGQVLDEVSTARALGVSRTPVRAAFQQLVHEELLDAIPGRGVMVKRLSVQDVREICQLRIFLEPEAARAAARHVDRSSLDRIEPLLRTGEHAAGAEAYLTSPMHDADQQLHALILTSCHNARLRAIVEGLTAQIERLQIALYPRRVTEAMAEHLAIVDCLRRRDGDGAHAAMHAHLEATQRALLRLVMERDDYQVGDSV